MKSMYCLIGLSCFWLSANADSVIEVYEDHPKTAIFLSEPFFESTSTIEVSYLRGKRLIPGVSREYLSKDVEVKITNPNFSGTEHTLAVFMNVCTDRRTSETHYRDVFWAELHWTGEAFASDRYNITFDYTDAQVSFKCRQEIAAVSNGHWMHNPLTGSNNFLYSMLDSD